ncbi:hypothetical protein H4Q26_013756 [Puccinia striiformis f. sp. tritici PST-130]|nr:hypothetical protein H4Q26_013756 [Puccinia striiformis f. sp. tritici PST-130]
MADNFNPINLYPAKDQTDTKDDNETEFGTNKSDHVYLRNTIDGIPILTMDNYSLWRKRFLRMLDLQGLTDAVTQPKGVLSDKQLTIITSTGAILDTKHVKFLDFEKPDLATQDDEDLEVFEHLDETLTAPAEVDTEVKIIEDSSPSPQIDIVSDSGSEQEEDTVEEEPVEGESSDEEDEVSESLVPQPSTGRTLRI